MASLPPPTAADTSAHVQHFLLYHGAAYTSRANETTWKRVPVSLLVPPSDLPDAPPPGAWLVLPWDAPTSDQVVAYFERLREAAVLPDVVVLVMPAPLVRESVVAQIGHLFGIEVVAVSALDRLCYGSPRSAHALQAMYDDAVLDALDGVNPLERLGGLGDPRDPAVFFERLKRTGGAPLTWLLIGANSIVFVAMVALTGKWQGLLGEFDTDSLRGFGANVKGLTVGRGETWRLLSCTFVHANLLHIGMNMWVLRAVGETAERLFGPAMFAALYLLAGLGGSIASLRWTLADAPENSSVGASGAVFGVMGGLLGFALARRASVPVQVYKGLLRSALFFSVVNVALGMMMPQVDNAAHIGGLVAGFFAGLVLSRDLPPAPQPSPAWRLGMVSACVAVLGVCFQFAVMVLF
jgi:membrane associated rhomboid family serine protease